MSNIIGGNIIMPGKYNNYFVGGNICNAFALGELGSDDDFFLIGAEPPDESSYPLLTGNIFDSEGNSLFRLVRNILVLNPGHCSKIISDHIGYEIHDGNGNFIFKISTVFEKLGSHDESYVTTFSANFYNNKGEVVFKAGLGEGNDYIEASTKAVFGFSGSFGIVQGFDKNELDIASLMLSTGGSINKVISGNISGQEVSLDGVALINATIDRCDVKISTGEFFLQNSTIKNSGFYFGGVAQNITNLLKSNGSLK